MKSIRSVELLKMAGGKYRSNIEDVLNCLQGYVSGELYHYYLCYIKSLVDMVSDVLDVL